MSSFYLFCGRSVLATTLLMSPTFYFLEMYGFEPGELPQQEGALQTSLFESYIYIY
jgi:hypothetical protein